MATRVGVVVLGDEVLRAETREANIAYMLPLLNEWGAEVVLCAILPDDVPLVVRHLRAYLMEADLLILTGGIGPTPDDITRDAVAEVAGAPLVLHPEAKAALEAYYGDRINEARLLMATVPAGSELIPNPLSAAPGFLVARMAVFPGVPKLLQGMFPWMRPRVQGPRPARVVLFTKAPESSYAGMMREAGDAFPDVRIGSYPYLAGAFTARVVFRSPAFGRAAACASFFEGRLSAAGYAVEAREEDPGNSDG